MDTSADKASAGGQQGVPPKSAQRIRGVLESVHRQAERDVGEGPLKEGLKADDRIVIWSFYNHDGCRRYQERLLAAGIMSVAKRRRRQTQVLVDVSDRGAAAKILAEQLAQFPDLLPNRVRRDFDFLILGWCIGAALGLVAVWVAFERDRNALTRITAGGLTFALVGALIGALIDMSRGAGRQMGRLQFGMRAILVLITTAALALFVWRLFTLR